ncbi:hypothetical protein PGN_0681 [Porphyromonas gingivalis ATCC 33277]|uniref:Uncharacterized protein n=1 Tax=Porphyromonas gingivalis (strain ATCC 33277 / DSM 20709 / CIP 103683 / JCM 12257 / NCTC 11834 / 2561) TaxID=431947 RepID=B2RIK5_PORG3|nr:hypothetical protein PGN_0681 [Porphyromonas gingivalis ATCC 33277]
MLANLCHFRHAGTKKELPAKIFRLIFKQPFS